LPISAPLIQSRQNLHYKQWQQYASHPERPECPWIPIESNKQILELSRQQPIELLLFSDASETPAQELLPRSRQSQRLSADLLQQISSLRSSQEMVAFFEKPVWEWEDLTPWVLYLDQLQDPGNLGTLLRTARATNMFSVATSPGSVACFNAKVIRASAASLFAVPFREGLKLEELKSRGYALKAATLQQGPSLFDARLESPLAIIIGNEGSGPTASTLAAIDDHLHIPMGEGSESLNAAVAGSLIAYEIFRRGGNHG
jgi:TrmH family RNA methyltransferase